MVRMIQPGFLVLRGGPQRFEVLVEGALRRPAHDSPRSGIFFQQLAQVATWSPGEAAAPDSVVTEGGEDLRRGDFVSRSIQRATPMILRAVEQVQDRAAEPHSPADRKRTDARTA